MKELSFTVGFAETAQEFLNADTSGYNTVYYTREDGTIFRSTKLQTGGKATVPVKEIPPSLRAVLLESNIIVPSLKFLPNEQKMPAEFLNQIVSFFKSLLKVGGNALTAGNSQSYEAMANIIWNPATGYRVGIPTQEVGSARVQYQHDDYDPSQGDIVIFDIHSHNNMGAFYSGTDDADDKNKVRYSAVAGSLGTKPSVICRFNLWADNYKVEDLSNLFEGTIDIDTVIPYPPEWNDKIKITSHNVYAYGKYTYPKAYGGSQIERTTAERRTRSTSVNESDFLEDFSAWGEYGTRIGGRGITDRSHQAGNRRKATVSPHPVGQVRPSGGKFYDSLGRECEVDPTGRRDYRLRAAPGSPLFHMRELERVNGTVITNEEDLIDLGGDPELVVKSMMKDASNAIDEEAHVNDSVNIVSELIEGLEENEIAEILGSALHTEGADASKVIVQIFDYVDVREKEYAKIMLEISEVCLTPDLVCVKPVNLQMVENMESLLKPFEDDGEALKAIALEAIRAFNQFLRR